MKQLFKSLFLLTLFFPFTTFAWNALGHMVVANIAYKNLDSDVRNKVDTMVANLHKEYPEINSFSQMAYWPDAIRSQKIDTYTRWHYIDTAFSTDGTPLKNLIDTDNAVWALTNIEKVVKNNKANPYERARFLAFFIHIVGDLHQPLHTVSYISAEHKDGDRGGNDYFVRYKGERINVHRLWDGGVGSFDSDNSINNADTVAANIMALYPKNSFGAQVNKLDPNEWAQEGVENAKKYVYNTPENSALANNDADMGKRVAQQEAALAGYRLAAKLNQLLG